MLLKLIEDNVNKKIKLQKQKYIKITKKFIIIKKYKSTYWLPIFYVQIRQI